MAVIHYSVGLQEYGPNNFHPPKRSDLRYWWREAKRVCRSLPDWEESFRAFATVDEDTIIFDLDKMNLGYVMIARKRHMR